MADDSAAYHFGMMISDASLDFTPGEDVEFEHIVFKICLKKTARSGQDEY
jgi:hypothetical protein